MKTNLRPLPVVFTIALAACHHGPYQPQAPRLLPPSMSKDDGTLKGTPSPTPAPTSTPTPAPTPANEDAQFPSLCDDGKSDAQAAAIDYADIQGYGRCKALNVKRVVDDRAIIERYRVQLQCEHAKIAVFSYLMQTSKGSRLCGILGCDLAD